MANAGAPRRRAARSVAGSRVGSDRPGAVLRAAQLLAAWGQGYATELARACLAWADEELDVPEGWAFVHPANTASRRVLERAGFAQARPLPGKERILLRRARGG